MPIDDLIHLVLGSAFTAASALPWWLGAGCQVLAIMIAMAAAIFAYRSARATRIAAQGHLFSELLLRYSSEEMRLSLLKMAYYHKLRESGEGKFHERVKELVAGRINEQGVTARRLEGVDALRRRVSHFFQMVLELYENKQLIDKAFLQHICSFSGFALLFSVVEHFEQEINPAYDRASFNRLLELSGREDADELASLRPHTAR
jgi:hypothetical protein